MSESIPLENRTPLLKPLLKETLQVIVRLKRTDLLTTLPYLLSLNAIVFYCLVDDANKTEVSEQAKAKYLEYGINSRDLLGKMEAILTEDKHLKECCVVPIQLANLIDRFINGILDETNNEIPDNNTFDSNVEAFFARIYEEPFKCFFFSHIFNFSAYSDHLEFGNINVRKLAIQEIPYITGENTPYSVLHPYQSGEYFIVTERDAVIENDVAGLKDAHVLADQFVTIFQYYKDGIIHLNYTTNFFRPIWVNVFRKYGTLYFGDNRRIAYKEGRHMYFLKTEEHEELKTWWSLFTQPSVLEKFEEERNSFGKIIELAGTYFESSHTQIDQLRRLIDLSIALEASFSPENKDEINFQLSQLAGAFIGVTPEEKQSIVTFVKGMYSKRSKLLHGNPKAFVDNFVTDEELERFSSIIRQGLLKFMVLYISGEEDHKKIIERIRLGLFNAEIRAQLEKETDIHRLIQDSIQ